MMTVLLFPLSALSQAAPASLEDGLRSCGQMADSAARYACYDRLTSTMRPGPAPTGSPGPTRSTIPSTLPSTTATTATAPQASAPTTAAENAEVEGGASREMTDTVAAVVQTEPGMVQVTLSGGQVWRQVNGRQYRLREGMVVKVYRGLFGGSWRLSSEELGSFIQVERVK